MTLPSRLSHRTVAALAAVGFSGLAADSALGGSLVSAAHGSTRSALVAAFAAADGSSAGVSSVYVLRRHKSLGVVCDHTVDAGTVAFVFRHSGRGWRYVTRGTRKSPSGSSNARGLERAC